MKIIHPFAAASLALMATATPAFAETRTYDFDTIDAISISSGIHAIVEVGSTQSVTIETNDPELFDRLELHVRNSRLSAGIEFSLLESIFRLGDPQITIRMTVQELHSAEGSSGADVEIDRMSADTVRLGASSGATVTAAYLEGNVVFADAGSGARIDVIEGTCEQLEADASSGARLDLEGLACQQVVADASSGASTHVFAIQSIDADASSGGSVRIFGGPGKIEVDSSSGGGISFR